MSITASTSSRADPTQVMWAAGLRSVSSIKRLISASVGWRVEPPAP
jgi:hypothetical protein